MTRTRLAAALAALTLLVAACGSASPASGSAAVVNGETISNQSVVDELQAIAGNVDYLTAVEGQVPVTGQTPGSFDAAFAAQVLTRQIKFALVGQEVRRRDVDVDDECRNEARKDVISQMAADPTAAEDLFKSFPQAYQDQLIEWNADVLALQGDMIDQGCVQDVDVAREYYEAHQDEFEQTCVSHILVDTQAEAEAIVLQLEQGADFAALAAQLSKDTGSAAQGGSVGCFTGGQFVPEFEAAALALDVGETSGPVQTQFGFHVIRVTDRNTPDFDAIVDVVQQKVDEVMNTGFGTFLDDAIGSAEVTVDERYGSWDAQAGEVTSPDASATTSSQP